MEIVTLGQASFKLKSHGVAVVTDPINAKVEADIVIWSQAGSVLETPKVSRIFVGPGEYEVAGVSLCAFAMGESNTVFVMEMEGLRVAHLGYLNRKLTEKEIETLGGVDILLLPVGGGRVLGPNEALEVVQAVEPILTVPMLYGAESGFFPVEDFLKVSGMAVEKMDKLVIKTETLGETERIILLPH